MVYPPLGPAFNEALKDIYTRQTRLSMVKTEDAYASQTRLTISVKVRYTNTKNPNLNVDQTFRAYRDFSSSQMLTQVQDELISQIVDELAELIFNATVGSW